MPFAPTSWLNLQAGMWVTMDVGHGFGIVLGSFCTRVGIVLGSFWVRFGIVLGSLWIRFGIVLVSVWDRFGVVLGPF